jgi:hypothetical protein
MRRKKRENLLLKLPGEVRNEIYALSFIADKEIVLRRPERQTPKSWHRARFRGPGLFLADKTIRRESLSVYYQCNSFRIMASGKDLEFAMKHLGEVEKACGELRMGNIVVEPQKHPHWKYALAYWWPIAVFIRGRPRNVGKVDQWMAMFEDQGSFPRWRAFGDMLKLAVKAKRSGHSLARLRKDYKEWAEKQLVEARDHLTSRRRCDDDKLRQNLEEARKHLEIVTAEASSTSVKPGST